MVLISLVLSFLISVSFAKTHVAVWDVGIDRTSKILKGDIDWSRSYYDKVWFQPSEFIDHGTSVVGVLLYGHPTRKSNIRNAYGFTKKLDVDVTFCQINLLTSRYVSSVGRCASLAIENKVDYVVVTVSGGTYSPGEFISFLRLSKFGIKVVVAAGNQGIHIGKPGTTACPACYSEFLTGMTVVGALGSEGKAMPKSNCGPQVEWALGHKVPVLVHRDRVNPSASGTSFAAPYWLHKELLKKEQR